MEAIACRGPLRPLFKVHIFFTYSSTILVEIVPKAHKWSSWYMLGAYGRNYGVLKGPTLEDLMGVKNPWGYSHLIISQFLVVLVFLSSGNN
jgi:hypothetical protein